VPGFQPLGLPLGLYLGLRPRLVCDGPSALDDELQWRRELHSSMRALNAENKVGKLTTGNLQAHYVSL
jgi:hypothetical protein